MSKSLGSANRWQIDFYSGYGIQADATVINSQTGGTTGWPNATGLVSGSRYSSDKMYTYYPEDGSIWSSNTSSAAYLLDNNIFLLAYCNQSGSPSSYAKGDTINFAFTGASMTYNEHVILYNIMTYFNDNIDSTF